MRTYTVTKREGEYLGPVDWEYDFRQHFNSHCCSEAQRDKYCAEAVENLRKLTDGGEWMATTDGGWPRFGWGKVLGVGMYDGWPWWRPVPSVCISGPLGGEWHSFYSVTGIEKQSGAVAPAPLNANDRIQRPPVENLSSAETASPGGSLQ